MIYLDYSATTPVDKRVLNTFNKVCLEYPGNSNSLHKLGMEAKELEDYATNKIAKILNLNNMDIIYTSGASESNNLAIKGICEKYKNRGKHIITTTLEHSSIYGPIDYLIDNGYSVDFVKLDSNGQVDLANLKEIIREDTILVSINAVNSEIGILQPIEEISKIVSEYPKCFFHCDMTQAIGKISVDIKDIDLVSFSAHKFFGIKGIGCLIKKEKIDLIPLIHGGKSTTVYRSGTPCLPLIVSISKSLRLALENITDKEKYVKELNNYLKNKLQEYDKVKINSNDKCIPHILNISVMGVKPETMLHALEKHEIYISTQSACSSNNSKSRAVYALTKDEDISLHSLRVSISHLTTKEEIDIFINSLKKNINKLNLR